MAVDHRFDSGPEAAPDIHAVRHAELMTAFDTFAVLIAGKINDLADRFALIERELLSHERRFERIEARLDLLESPKVSGT